MTAVQANASVEAITFWTSTGRQLGPLGNINSSMEMQTAVPCAALANALSGQGSSTTSANVSTWLAPQLLGFMGNSMNVGRGLSLVWGPATAAPANRTALDKIASVICRGGPTRFNVHIMHHATRLELSYKLGPVRGPP